MPASSSGAGLPEIDIVYALYDYCPGPSQSNCLQLQAGAQVRVYTRHPSGWWDGELNGARGWFPSNHVASCEDMVPRLALDTDTETDVEPEPSPPTPSQPIPSTLTDAALRLTAHVRAQRCSLYLSDADCIRSAVRAALRDMDCLHGDDPGAADPVVAMRRRELLSTVHRLVDLATELSGDIPRPAATDASLITSAYRVISTMSRLLDAVPIPSAVDVPPGSSSPSSVPMRPKGSAPALGVSSLVPEEGDPKVLLEEIKEACAGLKVVCPIFHRTILEHVRATALSRPADIQGVPLSQQLAGPSAEKVVDATLAVYDAIHQMIPALDRICLDRQLLRTHGRQLAFLRMTRGEFVTTSHNLLGAVRQVAADDTSDDPENKTLALLAAPAITAASELDRLGDDLVSQVREIVEDMPYTQPSPSGLPVRLLRPKRSARKAAPVREQEAGSLSDDGGLRRRRSKKGRGGIQGRLSLVASPRKNSGENQTKLPRLSLQAESSARLPPPSPATSSTTVASGTVAATPLEANTLRHKLSLRSRASSPFSHRRPSMDTLLSKVRRRSALPELVHPKPRTRSKSSELAPSSETPDARDEDEEVVHAPDGSVLGGTLAGLVRILTPSKGTLDAKLAQRFCFTLPMFTHPAHVADMVLERWTDGESTQRSNVLAFVRIWMSDACWRPDLDDPSPLPALTKLATQAGAADLVALVTRRSTGKQRAEMRIVGSSDSQIELVRAIDPPPRSALPDVLYSPPHWSSGPNPTASRSLLARIRDGSAKVTDIDTGEMARQLTVLVSRVYVSITPEEFWAKHAPSTTCRPSSHSPTASGMSSLADEGPMKCLSIISNQVAAWVQTSILACDTVKERRDVLQYFLKLSRKCLLLHNLHVFFSLQYGLSAITVRRLHQTWKELPSKYQERAKVYDGMVRPGRNFVEYRQLFSEALKGQYPFLPMVAIASADITFTLEGNAATRGSNAASQQPSPNPAVPAAETINWVRYDRLARIVADMAAAQRQLYALTAVPEIQAWLVHSLETAHDHHDDGGLYSRSVALEPRQPLPAPASSIAGPMSPTPAPSTGLSSPRTESSPHSKRLTAMTSTDRSAAAPPSTAAMSILSDTSSAQGGYASSTKA